MSLPAGPCPSLSQGFRAVVVGAGGGIGAAVAAQLAADPRCGELVAVSRRGDAGPPGAVRLAADITDDAALATLATRIDAPVDLIFIATGVLHSADMQPEKSWRTIRGDSMAASFAVNAAGPVLAVQALLPLVPRDRRALIGVIGARVGSIGDNRLGGWYSYRAAKAALAMLVRTLAIELGRSHPQLVLMLLHPGTVDTTLSAPFQRGVKTLLTPDASAAHLLALLDAASPDQSGQHRDWRGEPIIP